ncbi:hypothetical protein DW322_10245 [Rhodococcus rhodnii]|uniref:ESX-1 secretion-associated protein n=2 Tax=Rhodococcus rhodnii TaxID=38312 RepID=R7WN63_9NOCA|nr:type VII secretion target [Rhodococcus rhodnii]EOM75439.1 hypothetical protein Rrhod_3237 [Rhodococcus rhodnii LMG 5362]TXG90534.1 hypothetical protein DW322_10245 [Rhodococcus rhodnii]
MTDLDVDTGAVADFSAAAAAVAGDLLGAAATAAAAGPALLGPVFGLVGGDFVAAFAAAHADHVCSIERLSAVFSGVSAAADASVSAYTGTDDATATALSGTAALSATMEV